MILSKNKMARLTLKILSKNKMANLILSKNKMARLTPYDSL